MIKFFRDVRQKLLSQGKTGKYFKYAIGEIILVVIGILIALQINNWNNQQQNIEKEQRILSSLHAEFSQNLEELRRDHILNIYSLNACVAILSLDKQGPVDPKKIDSLIGKAYNYATFDARVGVITDIIASGNLELIRDENLRYVLNQWTAELNDYVEDVIIRRDYWVQNFGPLVDSFIPTRNSDAAQDRPDYKREIVIKPMEVPAENYVRFLNDLKMDGAMFNYYINQSFVTTNEESIEAYLLNVLTLIEQNRQHD